MGFKKRQTIKAAAQESLDGWRHDKDTPEREIHFHGFSSCLEWLRRLPLDQVFEVLSIDPRELKDKDPTVVIKDELEALEELIEEYGINRSLGNIADNLRMRINTYEQ